LTPILFLLVLTLSHLFYQMTVEGLGAEVLNDVELNQVLFRFSTDEQTSAVLHGVQESGEAWMGGTTWDGRAAIRISVSNWQTSDADVDRTLGVFAVNVDRHVD